LEIHCEMVTMYHDVHLFIDNRISICSWTSSSAPNAGRACHEAYVVVSEHKAQRGHEQTND